jgi:hypothetical protein
MEDKRKKVEGHNTLYRTAEGTIVNSDRDSYEAYIKKRCASKEKNETLKNLSEELANAKSEIEELKSLIKQIIHK